MHSVAPCVKCTKICSEMDGIIISIGSAQFFLLLSVLEKIQTKKSLQKLIFRFVQKYF